MKASQNKENVIIIAPHSDDEWIGCGCTILKSLDDGRKVKVILVTGRVKSRVKLSKKLANKYGYKLVFLNEQEKKLNESRIKDMFKKEIDILDEVFIPTCDTHQDHQTLNRLAKETLDNKKVFEYGIYNNSKNPLRRGFNKLKSIITKKGYVSFVRGTGKKVAYKKEVKQKHIIEFAECPRDADLIRPVKTKLNIAFLTKDYNTITVDAGFTSIVELAKQLQKRGHFVALISSKGDSSLYEPAADKEYELFKGVPIYRPYALKGFNNKKKHITITSLVNRFVMPALGFRYVQKKHNIKFDIIHGSSSASYLLFPSLLAKVFARHAKIFHTIRSESNYGLWGWKTSKLLNFSRGVFVPLNSLIQKLNKDGCKAEKLVLARSSIDLSKFSQVKTAAKDLRKQYNVKEDEKIVLYYGKGGHFKGVEVLIDAANYVIPKYKKVKFILVHPIVWLPHIEKMVKEHKFKKQVSLNVKKIHVPDYLNFADMQILPFRSIQGTEGNPLCLLEGMAAKTPIITTELKDLKEIVKKEKDVLMAKPEDAKSLAKEILRLLKDDKLREILAANAYKTSKQFDINITVDQYLKQYFMKYTARRCDYERIQKNIDVLQKT